MGLFDRLHMPELDGAVAWLNSEPLTPEALRGQVVLVDFWTLTCINWLRTEPYIRAWSRAYRDDGLVVIGAHTPEFSFERDVERVRQSVAAMDIDYPVAVDSDYAIWNAFSNHYWPAAYFIDKEGVIRHHVFGEGQYEEQERVVQQLLGIDRDLVDVEGVGIEAAADWDQVRSPEAYLGYGRGQGFDSPGDMAYDESRAYALPEHLPLNHWALSGKWTIGGEQITVDEAGAGLAFRFHARDAHLVLKTDIGSAIPFRLLLDGELPGDAHGLDVATDGRGTLQEGRLYQLVRQHGDVQDRTLEINFLEPGAEAYVFTFG